MDTQRPPEVQCWCDKCVCDGDHQKSQAASEQQWCVRRAQFHSYLPSASMSWTSRCARPGQLVQTRAHHRGDLWCGCRHLTLGAAPLQWHHSVANSALALSTHLHRGMRAVRPGQSCSPAGSVRRCLHTQGLAQSLPPRGSPSAPAPATLWWLP